MNARFKPEIKTLGAGVFVAESSQSLENILVNGYTDSVYVVRMKQP